MNRLQGCEMKKLTSMIFLIVIPIMMNCGGSSSSVKLGDCPLTISVKAEGTEFDGYANVYIDGKFIGTTDSESKTLRINLKKGEYTIIVVAEGYRPWKNKVLLLGRDYQQNMLARLKKKTSPEETEIEK